MSRSLDDEYLGLHCLICGRAKTGNTDMCTPCGLKSLRREQQAENARIREEERYES